VSNEEQAPQAAILTIEAASPGGVPALVDTVYRFMEKWGYKPTVYRTQFAAGNLSRWQRIGATLRAWRPRRIAERALDTVIVPAPPTPLWLFYLAPHFLFGPLLSDYDAFFVASGSAHVALPLALRGRRYALWVATLYADELRAKAASGDAWAQGVLNSPTWRLLAWQERFALRRARRVLALSHHTARRIVAEMPDLAGRVETVLYPVDTARYRPNRALRERPPYGEYLLLAARINDPRKNAPLLLQAFARVRASHPHLKLVLTGDEPDAAITQLIRDLAIEAAVVCLGIVADDELLRLYQGAQLFVLPSTQEGLGIVVLESLACGTPVVATRCGGPEGLVIDGETGLNVPINDVEAMAAAIRDLLGDPARLAQMRARCAAFAAEHYALPVIERQLRDAYTSTLGGARHAAPLRVIWQTLAAAWAVLVFVEYMRHQMTLHWEAIRAQIVEPLLSALSR
jgi:glycosyltransferase involved in cell wall biosynthesis